MYKVPRVPASQREAMFLARVARLGGRPSLNKRQAAAALRLHRRVPGYRASDVLVILQLRGV